MTIESFKNLAFRFRHGFRGYPQFIRGFPIRLDESLRRFSLDGELAIQETLEQFLVPGGTFIDVGANFGMHTLLGCHLIGSQGRVLAVEPVPENLRLLRRNLQLNGFEQRAQVVPKALVSESQGEMEMTIEPGVSLAASLANTNLGRKILVQTTSLDEIFDCSWKCPDLIKIDVEGAEHEVLKGAHKLLSLGPPLLVEVHTFALPSFGSSPEALREYLASFGYVEEQISEMESHLGEYFHALYRVP